MRGSGDQGAQPVLGLLAAAANRREEESHDAAPCEQERGAGPRGSDRSRDEGPSADQVEVAPLPPRTLPVTDRPSACEARGNKGSLRDRSPRPPRGSGGRVAYVCPEASCARRGRRWKLKCDLCGGRYAADHDWEAHAKVCGAAREHRQDGFLTRRAFRDALARQPMNVATVASALHRLALPSQAGEHGSADGASGLGLDTKDLNLSMPVVRADGSSGSGGGFARSPFRRSNHRVGCVAGACTRPELPPRGSLSRPVVEAAARAHAVANQHACERCREYLINAEKGR